MISLRINKDGVSFCCNCYQGIENRREDQSMKWLQRCMYFVQAGRDLNEIDEGDMGLLEASYFMQETENTETLS